jgi:DNA-binding NarL/FixJ family response regulator
MAPREREIVVAVAMGEDREELARSYNTSRANIDQIVSRARRRLHGEDAP